MNPVFDFTRPPDVSGHVHGPVVLNGRAVEMAIKPFGLCWRSLSGRELFSLCTPAGLVVFAETEETRGPSRDPRPVGSGRPSWGKYSDAAYCFYCGEQYCDARDEDGEPAHADCVDKDNVRLLRRPRRSSTVYRQTQADRDFATHAYAKQMSYLAYALPALKHKIGDPINGLDPWQPVRLLKQMAPWSHGERLAAQFLLHLWGGRFTKDKRRRFDLVEAMGTWDDENMRAFVEALDQWSKARWWP